MADDRLFQIFVKIHRLRHADRFAAPASDTLFCIQIDAAALSDGERPRRAHFCARGLAAAVTDRFDEFSRKPAVCANFDAAFLNGVILPVDSGADEHARKTADTFGHVVCF